MVAITMKPPIRDSCLREGIPACNHPLKRGSWSLLETFNQGTYCSHQKIILFSKKIQPNVVLEELKNKEKAQFVNAKGGCGPFWKWSTLPSGTENLNPNQMSTCSLPSSYYLFHVPFVVSLLSN